MNIEQILELDSKDKVKSHIYVIKNKINDKVYIGQANTHRLNKNKYRYFGYIGRFNDHISEALSNTKKKQCWYLNNSIRKNGKDNFCIELIETCDIDKADEREIYHINEYNSMYPNGYNLTKGGKNFTELNIERDLELNDTKEKRGRDFGYTHKGETIEKMKQYYENKKTDIDFQEKIKLCMKKTITSHFENNRIEKLSKMNLKLPLEQYIYPVYIKNTDTIQNYAIRIIIKRGNAGFRLSTNDPIEKKYEILLNNLKKAYEKSKNCSDNPKGLMDHPQPLA